MDTQFWEAMQAALKYFPNAQKLVMFMCYSLFSVSEIWVISNFSVCKNLQLSEWLKIEFLFPFG